MLIDAHTHAYTKPQIQKLLSSMKKNGVDHSIILYCPNLFEKAPPLSKVIDNVKKHDNLSLVGSLQVTDKKNFEKQLHELDAALSKKQIVGIKLYLGYEHFFANDPRCDPIYRLCVKYDVPMIYHTGDTWRLKTAIIRFANPLYIDDVAVKYPKLKIIISHLGNPCWIKETAEVLYKNKNVYGDISGMLAFPGAFEQRDDEDVKKEIMELVDYVGTPRKLLFGSDYNIYDQGKYLQFLESFEEFLTTDLEYIKYKNAKKLFRI